MQILYLHRFDGLNPAGVIQGKKQTLKSKWEKNVAVQGKDGDSLIADRERS